MQTKGANEAELIARITAGEKELFHDLIRPYERMVYLTLLSIVKNEADAEDGAHEDWTRINGHFQRIPINTPFKLGHIATTGAPAGCTTT